MQENSQGSGSFCGAVSTAQHTVFTVFECSHYVFFLKKPPLLKSTPTNREQPQPRCGCDLSEPPKLLVAAVTVSLGQRIPVPGWHPAASRRAAGLFWLLSVAPCHDFPGWTSLGLRGELEDGAGVAPRSRRENRSPALPQSERCLCSAASRARAALSDLFGEGFEMSACETLGPRGDNRRMEGFRWSCEPLLPAWKLLAMRFLLAFKPLG